MSLPPCLHPGCDRPAEPPNYVSCGHPHYEAPSARLSASTPDFHKLFEEVGQLTRRGVKEAAMDGVRLGIGFSASSVDAAIKVADQFDVSDETIAWLRLVANELRKASVSDELARWHAED